MKKHIDKTKVKKYLDAIFDLTHYTSHMVEGKNTLTPKEIKDNLTWLKKRGVHVINNDKCPACEIHDILQKLYNELGIEF